MSKKEANPQKEGESAEVIGVVESTSLDPSVPETLTATLEKPKIGKKKHIPQVANHFIKKANL